MMCNPVKFDLWHHTWICRMIAVSNYITLHCSYLARPKYKTAKPLLYTVYRTRNWKQSGRKGLGKEISFEVVLKNSQRMKLWWLTGCTALQSLSLKSLKNWPDIAVVGLIVSWTYEWQLWSHLGIRQASAFPLICSHWPVDTVSMSSLFSLLIWLVLLPLMDCLVIA